MKSKEIPKVGDLLIITTNRSCGKKFAVKVIRVINGADGIEIIIGKRNVYFNWGMYLDECSWVYTVENVGNVSLTSSTNSMLSIKDI